MKHRSVAFACVAALALLIAGAWTGTTVNAAGIGTALRQRNR